LAKAIDAAIDRDVAGLVLYAVRHNLVSAERTRE